MLEKLPDATGQWPGPAMLVPPASAFAAAAIALGTLLLRWYEAEIVDEVARAPVTVPATALGLLIAALALLLLRPSSGVPARRWGRLAAALGAALGFLIIGQYVFDWIGGVERGPFLAAEGWWARRPSPSTGLGLVFLFASLLALGAANGRVRGWAGPAAAAALTVAFTGLAGHLYGASMLYGENRWGGTAVSTALALGALACGIFFADSSRGVAAVGMSDSTGGYLLRRFLPAALLAPLLFGWLALSAQQAGLFGAAFATALLVVALIVLLVGSLARLATVLHRVDVERARLLAGERRAREQASNILESITDAFFAVNNDWRFTYLNREAERVLQRPRDQLLGRSVWEEYPEAVGARFQREYQRAMEEQVTVQFEEYYPPLGIWFDVRAFPTADGLSVYFRDMTERKRTEEVLRESEEGYRLLADMIPQHIWTTDPKGYHNYFSRRWYEYTGAAAEQTMGKGWLDMLHPEDRERTIERWQHSLRTGEPYAIEYRFRDADGNYGWFLGQALPLRNEAGEIIRWFGTLTDISEQKRLEEEREGLLGKEQEARAESERRREELERVTESRARLMRGFSHDVKNPLSAADLNALLLEGGKAFGSLSDKQRESVGRIRRSIGESIRLLDDLLELARAEAGQLDLKCGMTDVSKAVRDVTEDFRAQATAAGLALDIRVPEGLRAETDLVRLRQILGNLLSNAVKYAPNGRLTVDAGIRRSGGPGPGEWIAMSVIDTGPGIPESKRELIFQEYTRLEPGARHGAGIGLTISRHIARLLGGDLSVESKPGCGATFILWLPAPRPG